MYITLSLKEIWKAFTTIKNIMNTFCLDSQKDMDDGVHMLLFAAREAFHESLRCSPLGLVFGHSVGGLF